MQYTNLKFIGGLAVVALGFALGQPDLVNIGIGLTTVTVTDRPVTAALSVAVPLIKRFRGG